MSGSPSDSFATYNAPHVAASAVDARVSVITGATRGIGRASALALAKLGGEIVLVGRDAARLDAVSAEIRGATGNARVSSVVADFASLDSIRRGAEEIVSRWRSIHVLVNNAGLNAPTRQVSVDGHELTFQVNCLSPFLLTALLVPSLARGAPSRVIDVTSVFARFGRVDVDDLVFARRGYSSTRAYTQSKLASTMLTVELAARLRGLGISANAVSPALVATDLLRHHWYSAPWLRAIWSRFLLTPDAAAQRIVRVATSPALADVTGQCFAGGDRPVGMPRAARDDSVRRRLWDVAAAAAGVASDLAARSATR